MARVKKEKKELRMYGMVPYNISPIQQSIQFGHAVVEYGLNNNTSEYKDWAKNWKTFIILNGGTTNLSKTKPGTLNKHLIELKKMGVKVATFYEPDLGDQLTAVVFILNEQVFDKIKYPNYEDWLVQNNLEASKKEFGNWLEFLGGYKNMTIRNYISKFKLA